MMMKCSCGKAERVTRAGQGSATNEVADRISLDELPTIDDLWIRASLLKGLTQGRFAGDSGRIREPAALLKVA